MARRTGTLSSTQGCLTTRMMRRIQLTDTVRAVTCVPGVADTRVATASVLTRGVSRTHGATFSTLVHVCTIHIRSTISLNVNKILYQTYFGNQGRLSLHLPTAQLSHDQLLGSTGTLKNGNLI